MKVIIDDKEYSPKKKEKCCDEDLPPAVSAVLIIIGFICVFGLGYCTGGELRESKSMVRDMNMEMCRSEVRELQYRNSNLEIKYETECKSGKKLRTVR